MDVQLFPDARVTCDDPPVNVAKTKTTVQRACYNIHGLSCEEQAAHLKRLYLCPRVGTHTTKRKHTPAPGYSCATKLQHGALAVPRFYGTAYFGPPREDRTTHGTPVSFPFTGELLPYQHDAVSTCSAVIRREGGAMLCSGCGTGKTVMAIALAARLGVRTVVLVHKQFLLEQWRARITQFAPGARVGVVAQGRSDMADSPDIILCMIQTVLSRHPPAAHTFDTVGLVICDECHHVCAQSFMRALTSFPARWRLGLTATPERRDGLGFALHWLLGPLAVVVKRTGTPVDVQWLTGSDTLEPVRSTRGEMQYAATVSRLVSCRDRNNRILECIRVGLQHGRQIIVISERRGHMEDMCTRAMELPGSDPSLYLGETSVARTKERDDRALVANPLFASYSLSAEALDIPRLDMLIFASPRGAPACIEQCVGRIMRTFPGKPIPMVVDFRDSVFSSMARERARLYSRERFTQVKVGDVGTLLVSRLSRSVPVSLPRVSSSRSHGMSS